MRDFPHTAGAGPHTPPRPLIGLALAAALLALLGLLTVASALAGPAVLERLARTEPRPRVAGGAHALAVARLELDAPAGAPRTARELWPLAAQSARPEPYLAGALRAEQAGHAAEARLWLILAARALGEAQTAAALAAPAGEAGRALLAAPPPGAAPLAPSLATRLHDSL